MQTFLQHSEKEDLVIVVREALHTMYSNEGKEIAKAEACGTKPKLLLPSVKKWWNAFHLEWIMTQKLLKADSHEDLTMYDLQVFCRNIQLIHCKKNVKYLNYKLVLSLCISTEVWQEINWRIVK